MVFRRMQVGDVVVLRSDEDAQLLRAIEGNEVANWAPGNWKIPDMTLSVKKISDSKYDYSWCEKLQCPKWWSTCTLPNVRRIPEGYEPAFEGEEIGDGWMYHKPGVGWVKDCMTGKVDKETFPIIKPKKPVSSGPAIPDGYESIQEGDAIQAGDLHFSLLKKWEPVVWAVGSKYRPEDWPGSVVRKKPEPQLEHGPIPEGYKLYEDGEILESGDMFWYPTEGKWILLDYKFGEKKPSHWTSVIIKRINKPTISTMEHQDGATTTTVSVGGVGSKFEKNGREYEVTHETEVAHSNGLREIEIKAVSRPVYGQSPVKTAVDEMEKMWPSFKDLMLQDPLLFLKTKPSKQAADALDAVAEASKMLESRPSWVDLLKPDIKKLKQPKYLSDALREQEIKEIVQSVVEKLS